MNTNIAWRGTAEKMLPLYQPDPCLIAGRPAYWRLEPDWMSVKPIHRAGQWQLDYSGELRVVILHVNPESL